jgi:hypothetical protein
LPDLVSAIAMAWMSEFFDLKIATASAVLAHPSCAAEAK